MDFRRMGWIAVALCGSAGARAAEVTIYRCTDAHARLTLRDTPCRKGERQQTREMLRPTDPPPRVTRPVATKATRAAPPAPTRVVVVQPARPLYECINPDGAHYTSDSADGNLRWVPLPILGYPIYPRRGYGGGLSGRLDYRNGPLQGRVDLGRPPPPADLPPTYPPPIGTAYGYPAGTWVRDACYSLPQQDVCARLSDRRYELDRQYNSALQSERARITTEQRGIDARLVNDCGAY